MDSYGKLPSGVLDGNFFWPGSYDQCRSIEAPQLPNAEQHLNGQYCLVHISKKPASIVVSSSIAVFPVTRMKYMFANLTFFTYACINIPS